MPRVGIVGDDTEARLVATRIKRRKSEPFFLFRSFPERTRIAFAYRNSFSATVNGVSLSEFDSILIRTYAGLALPQAISLPPPSVFKKVYKRYQHFLHNEFEKLSQTYSLLRAYERTGRLVNQLGALDFHWQKPFQFLLMLENGLPVPEFVCGNDVAELAGFIRASPGESVVYKSLSGTGQARRITMDYFKKHRAGLRYEPILVQKVVRGENIRTYVLDGKVIGSGSLQHEGFDSGSRIKSIAPIDLPERIEEAVIRAARTLGMIFTGVDVILDQNDQFYLLECNDPAGFATFERLTHIPISDFLAEYLVGAAQYDY